MLSSPRAFVSRLVSGRSARGIFGGLAGRRGDGKHAMNVNDLITGKPENAARGLYYFMGVKDPFASDGVSKIVAEVAAFITYVSELPPEKVVAEFKRSAWANDGDTAEQIVEIIKREARSKSSK